VPKQPTQDIAGKKRAGWEYVFTTSVTARADYGSKKNEEKNTKYRCIRRLKKRSIFGLNALAWLQIQVLPVFLPLPRILKQFEKRAKASGSCLTEKMLWI
jgi:hypothetical protein